MNAIKTGLANLWMKKWLIFSLIFFTGLAILAIIGFLRFGNLLAFFSIFPWISEKIAGSTGMNVWLSKILGIIVAVILVFSFSMSVSRNPKLRKRGFQIITGVYLCFCLMMFFISKDYNFSPDGKTNKCVAATPYDYEEVSCGYTVHPVYGTKVIPFTAEMAMSRAIKNNGTPTIRRVTPSKDMSFFAPDGTPMFYYYQHENGQLEFFDTPGRHPQLNTLLVPINPETVKLFFAYVDEGRNGMIIVSDGSTEAKPITDQSENPLLELANYLKAISKQ